MRTGEHSLASLLQLDLFSELEQQLNGLGGNQVLGEVNVQFVSGEAELLGAGGVGGKPLAQVRGECLVMSGQSRQAEVVVGSIEVVMLPFSYFRGSLSPLSRVIWDDTAKKSKPGTLLWALQYQDVE